MEDGFLIRGTKVKMPYRANLTPAEVRLVFGLQRYFQPENILADFYLPKADRQERLEDGRKRLVAESEQLLQIDCVAVGRAGVFVFESKDYQGWIYGHGERKYWTQVVKYGREKHQFYNPLWQNAAHVEAVKKVVGEKMPVWSIVVFGRQAELKVLENIPKEVKICTQAGLYKIMESFPLVLEDREMADVMATLRRSGVRPSAMVRDEHQAEVERLVKWRKN